MAPDDRAAQEEFLRKTERLYRVVNGALHSAEDVESRLKAIREALHETPAVEKQLGAVADGIEQRDREILRALRGDVETAKRNEPVPSSIDQRVISIMDEERFSLAKPTQSHLDSYNIAAAEFAEQLGKLRTLMEVDSDQAGERYGSGGSAVDSGAGSGVVGEIAGLTKNKNSPQRTQRARRNLRRYRELASLCCLRSWSFRFVRVVDFFNSELG